PLCGPPAPSLRGSPTCRLSWHRTRATPRGSPHATWPWPVVTENFGLLLLGTLHSAQLGLCTRLLLLGGCLTHPSLSISLVDLDGPHSAISENGDLLGGHGQEPALHRGHQLLTLSCPDDHDAILDQLAEQWLVTWKHADLALGGLRDDGRRGARPQRLLHSHQFSGNLSHVCSSYLSVSFLYPASTSSRPPRSLKACSG